MVLRIYLFSLYLTFFLSLGLLCLILFNVNPFASPYWLHFLFYFTFFLVWVALFGLIGFYLKIWAANREVIFAHLWPTLRQSIFIGLGITSLLFLYQIKVLNWWVGILLVFALLMLELFFRRK